MHRFPVHVRERLRAARPMLVGELLQAISNDASRWMIIAPVCRKAAWEQNPAHRPTRSPKTLGASKVQCGVTRTAAD